MTPGNRMRAAPGLGLASPATSRARMAATSCSATARWAGFAPRRGYRCDADRAACQIGWSGSVQSGSVQGAQRQLGGAIGHPTAGKGNVAAILRVDREEFHPLAISPAGAHRALTCLVLRRQ